ncbi:unnamed protein product, partial [Nesidiocoris tenuis]
GWNDKDGDGCSSMEQPKLPPADDDQSLYEEFPSNNNNVTPVGQPLPDPEIPGNS